MPTQKFSASDENKKKIKQLEKDIKLMKKDLAKTFADAEKPQKQNNKMIPIYIGIGVLVICVVILAVIYFYLNSLMA
ncbi:MAG: hypothetical protein K2J76_06025 [Oscillospiraceae bacterium]|nr:hypothetical protein [Oscillospiraceae bacterium]